MTVAKQVTAALSEDQGMAASSEDFFRSPEFLTAEEVTHSLILGDPAGPTLVAPLIVRDIPGAQLRDAISPYGYPGGETPAGSPDPAAVDWSGTGLVSIFIRDRVGGEGCLRGGSERGVVQVADPRKASGVRTRLQEQIRASARAGYGVERIPGPEAGEDQRASFERAYAETMRRNEAAERYLFGSAYFEAILASPRSWLLLARDGSGAPAAGAIAVISDGFLHYFLGGTLDRKLEDSPMKSIFAELIEQARELELPLSLGGGLRPGDGLERFKRGFANATLPFRTHEVVCDPDAYERLSAGIEAEADFFPLYRAPARS